MVRWGGGKSWASRTCSRLGHPGVGQSLARLGSQGSDQTVPPAGLQHIRVPCWG